MKKSYIAIIICIMNILQGCDNLKEYRVKNKLHEAAELEKANKYNEALIAINDCLELDSTSIAARIERGDIEMQLDKYRDALKDYFQVVNIHPSNTKANYGIGLVYYLMDKFDSSIIWYNKAISTKGNDSIYLVYQDNDITKNILQFDVDVPVIRFKRALSYYYSKDYGNAFRDFSFCISKGYRTGDAYLYNGVMYIDGKDNERGCNCLKLSLSNGNKDAQSYIDKYCKQIVK